MRSLHFGLLILLFFGTVSRTAAKDAFAAVGSGTLDGVRDVYARIPPTDDLGRDQISMFRAWNPDPIGNHEANLKALDPSLARVIRKTEADNPGLPFVIGSGKRDAALQRRAVAWGWSRTRHSYHRTGRAVDLWPLDPRGHISFDREAQDRIGAAMKKAASELHVSIRWGGNFRSFKKRDRSHFELVAR